MPRDLDTASCIYCRLPKKEHWPTCPVRRTEWEKTWEQLKAWAFITVVFVGWMLLLGGFKEWAELLVP